MPDAEVTTFSNLAIAVAPSYVEIFVTFFMCRSFIVRPRHTAHHLSYTLSLCIQYCLSPPTPPAAAAAEAKAVDEKSCVNFAFRLLLVIRLT